MGKHCWTTAHAWWGYMEVSVSCPRTLLHVTRRNQTWGSLKTVLPTDPQHSPAQKYVTSCFLTEPRPLQTSEKHRQKAPITETLSCEITKQQTLKNTMENNNNNNCKLPFSREIYLISLKPLYF